MIDKAIIRTQVGTALWMGLAALLPFSALLSAPEACLFDPNSEWPVKFWGFEEYLDPKRLYGGWVKGIGYPFPGPLNNPDLPGTLIVGGLRHVLGWCGAWNLYAFGSLWANGLAAATLARPWAGGELGARVAGISVVLMPLLLVYCVSGAVTDMLQLWPYLLALHFARRGFETRSLRAAGLSGIMGGLGFLICPYNALVFAPMVLPLSAALAWPGPARLGLGTWPSGRELLRQVATLLLGLGLTVGPAALWIGLVMGAESSQMSDETVALTRHGWPYATLLPSAGNGFTTELRDFVAFGADGVRTRDNVSRFYRAHGLGLLLPLLTLFALFRPGPHRAPLGFWSVVAAFFLLASLGPFMPVTPGIASTNPINPIYLGLHTFFPGQKMLLEPFRYALLTGLAMAMAGGVAAQHLHGFRPRLARVVPVLMLLELAFVGTVHRPMPTHVPHSNPAWASLDDVLPPGPIVVLPFFEKGSRLYNRRPFFEALDHGRPIPHVVSGFPPKYLRNNLLTHALLYEEQPPAFYGFGRVEDRLLRPGMLELQRAGFVGIVVDPSHYASTEQAHQVRQILSLIAQPLERNGLWIWRLGPPPHRPPNRLPAPGAPPR